MQVVKMPLHYYSVLEASFLSTWSKSLVIQTDPLSATNEGIDSLNKQCHMSHEKK